MKKTTLRFTLLALSMFFATALGAQVQREDNAQPRPARDQPENAAVGSLPSPITAKTVSDGTAGLLDLNGSTSPFTTSGVFFQTLDPQKPNVSAKLGTSDANSAFSLFNSANTSLLSINGLGRVGIGTSSPESELHVISTATTMPRGLIVDQYATGAGGRIILRKARGTPAAPAAVAQLDAIGNLHTTTFDGSSWLDPASIRFFVDGAVSTGHVPTGIEFRTGDGPSNGGGSGFPRMGITSAGLVGIGTSTPTALLTVGDSGGTGNKVTINGDATPSPAPGVTIYKEHVQQVRNVLK